MIAKIWIILFVFSLENGTDIRIASLEGISGRECRDELASEDTKLYIETTTKLIEKEQSSKVVDVSTSCVKTDWDDIMGRPAEEGD